jgi:hypothetical protein
MTEKRSWSRDRTGSAVTERATPATMPAAVVVALTALGARAVAPADVRKP